MLEKKISFDHTITEIGHIQVRKITRILDDGKEISKQYHRHVVDPGQDTTGEDDRTKVLAATIHTKEVVDNYKNILAEQAARQKEELG